MLRGATIFLFSIVISTVSYSQDFDEISNQAMELLHNKEYEKAIPVIEKTIAIAIEKFGENNSNVLDLNYLLATCFRHTREYEKAELQYLKTIELQKRVLGEDHIDCINSMDELASVYADGLNYQEAERLFLYVLELRKKKTGKNEGYASCLSRLGTLYLNTGQYDKAEVKLIEAKEIRKKLLGTNDSGYATSLNDLGELYRRKGKYKIAEAFFIQANEVSRKSEGENSVHYAICLNNLGTWYLDMSQLVKAGPLLKKSGEIMLALAGEYSPEYANILNNLGELYRQRGEYKTADSVYRHTLRILKKITGEDHPDYATTLNNLATLYREMGQYEKAEAFYLRTNEIDKKVSGEQHPDYATSLSNLADLYEQMGQYKKAELLFLKSAGIIKDDLGEDHPSYAKSLNNLGNLYAEMGMYEKGLDFSIRALELRKITLGEDHLEYAISLNSLSGIYSDLGQYEKALPLSIQAKEIVKNNLGAGHPQYADALNYLGELYHNIGRFEMAEPILILAKETTRKALGEKHPGYANKLYSLAQLYLALGQYGKAAVFLMQAKSIRQETLGKNHPDFAATLTTLGTLYERIGEYKKAESAFLQATEIKKNTLGEAHSDYASSLDDLGELYTTMLQYDKAEAILLQSNEIKRKSLGADHPNYASGLNSLALLYSEMGKNEKAEKLFIEATEIEKKSGDRHPDYAGILSNLAMFYAGSAQPAKAEPLVLLNSQIVLQNLTNAFAILSEKEKGEYLENKVTVIEINNSFLYHYRSAASSICRNNFNLQLALKSFSLTDTRNMVETVYNSPDTTLKKLFVEWKDSKNFLSKQYSLPVSNRITGLETEETKTEDLEKELARRSFEFRDQQATLRISMNDVQKNLEENEAAVEFVRFRLFNKKWTDSIMYAAYVLKKNDTVPGFVPLFEERQLQLLCDRYGRTATELAKIFYAATDTGRNAKASAGDKLYDLVWRPLEPFLKDVKKISYSPAGKLYAVSFNALPAGDGKLLLDKYQLQQYLSTRQIASRAKAGENTRPGDIVLFGDANFTMDSLELIRQRKTGVASVYLPTDKADRSKPWRNLPGTAEELKIINELFRKNSINTKTFVKAEASEENLKALSGHSPKILHIGTHGFFLPPLSEQFRNNDNAYDWADDPLLRSGLILAGGNYAWSGRPPVTGVEDGVVTAYEISQLNFSNIELATVSACETALGDIVGNEGVFGLQRAFKMAGVKKMLVSLWMVPDAQTAELMISFYSYWVSGKSIAEAFYQVQSDMRKKYAPYYWAAFVLVE